MAPRDLVHRAVTDGQTDTFPVSRLPLPGRISGGSEGVTLSHCPAVPLSHCPTVPLSHCLPTFATTRPIDHLYITPLTHMLDASEE